MKRLLWALTFVIGLFVPGALLAEEKLRIGITLHPYYSFVAAIVGDKAEVIPLIPADVNPHGYRPQTDDIKRAQNLDALVVNGIGHDEWALEIVQAAGNAELHIIQANASVALIPISGDIAGTPVVNPHTFVSTTAAVQQVYEIARGLSELDPDNGVTYRRNARAYATRIRALRAEYIGRLVAFSGDGIRFATMHAGYDYLFQEIGLSISTVIEPRHGIAPTARQLAQTIDAINQAGIKILFAEKYFSGPLAETIERETGVRIFALSHISEGPFTPEKFEIEMRENLETIIVAFAQSGAQ